MPHLQGVLSSRYANVPVAVKRKYRQIWIHNFTVGNVKVDFPSGHEIGQPGFLSRRYQYFELGRAPSQSDDQRGYDCMLEVVACAELEGALGGRWIKNVGGNKQLRISQ